MEGLVLSLFCAALLLGLVMDISMLYALVFGLILFWFYGRRKGFGWKELTRMTWEGISTVSKILITFLLIGVMTALWRAAGTVPLIAESELSSTSAYALSEESLYQAGNVEELASKLDWWYEHREQLPKMGRRYIDLARTFTTEICAEKVREMMQDSIFKKKSMVPKTD